MRTEGESQIGRDKKAFYFGAQQTTLEGGQLNVAISDVAAAMHWDKGQRFAQFDEASVTPDKFHEMWAAGITAILDF